MEEKFVRNMSLLVACLAILICSGLYYLPMLEVQAEEYVARQLRARRERREREEMLAMLSGGEILDDMTEQARATAEELAGEQHREAVEALDFRQQLRLELPKNVSRDDVTIENNYMSRTIDISIGGAGEDYLVNYPMIGKSSHIEDLNYYAEAGTATVELVMEQIYEMSLDWEEQYLYIDFVLPQERYDKLVVIDAGHGAKMPGATVGGVMEKDIDLAIVKELKAIFDSEGDGSIGVYYTRLDDSDPMFADRSGLANEIGADLFVSIHNNSYQGSSGVHGTTVLYDEAKPAEGNSSMRLATIMLEQVTEALGSKKRGLTKGNDIYVIRTCEAPAVLVEVGFMTNPAELARLTDAAYQRKCAWGIYEGILQAFEEGF